MSPAPLRILIVEDQASDAELVLSHLRRAGLVFESVCVETREAFQAALDVFTPHVVVTDFHLPAFDAHAALTILRERDSDVPVVVTSGLLSDEEVAPLIDAGAVDYVLKDRLARLGPAVRRAIDDSGERRQRTREIGRLSRAHELLRDTAALVVRTRSRAELFQETCRVAVERGGFAAAAIVLRDGATTHRVAAHGVEPGLIDRLCGAPAGTAVCGALAAALRTEMPSYCNDVLSEPSLALGHEVFRDLGLAASAALPLRVDGRITGCLCLFACEAGVFDAREGELLEQIAANVSFAIDFIAKDERIDYLALYDPLTQLPNRKLFLRRLGQLMETSGTTGQALVVMAVEVRHLGAMSALLNGGGSRMLVQRLAQRMIRAAASSSDTGALGAETFALVLSELPGASAQWPSPAFWDQLERPLRIDGKDLRPTLTVGTARFPEHSDDAESLLRHAEMALHEARGRGERCVAYSPAMGARVTERARLEAQLRETHDRGGFSLHYQPKVQLSGGTVCGVEALLRLPGVQGAGALPERFVPVLEETGMILEVGRWVLHKALADRRRWLASGLAAPRVAVNISQRQLHQADFVEQVQQALEASDTTGDGLELEVTESMLMVDVETSISKLRRLREQGVRVVIDDFGTGHSSLAYLARLPIDGVKIDRGFVEGMLDDPDTLSIVSAILSLSRSMRLRVTAEGVDTPEQLRLLRLLRCDEIQGWLFSMALPAESLADLLRANARLDA